MWALQWRKTDQMPGYHSGFLRDYSVWLWGDSLLCITPRSRFLESYCQQQHLASKPRHDTLLPYVDQHGKLTASELFGVCSVPLPRREVTENDKSDPP